MLAHTEILEIVTKSISSYLGAPVVPLCSDSLLKEEYGLDSTEMVFVAIDIEKALGLSMKGIKFATLRTPDDIVLVIIARLQAVEQKSTCANPV